MDTDEQTWLRREKFHKLKTSRNQNLKNSSENWIVKLDFLSIAQQQSRRQDNSILPLLNIENMNGNFFVSAVCLSPTLHISPICGYNSAFHYDSFWISALNSSTFISDKFRTSDSFEWIPTFRKRRQLGEWENFFGTLQHDTAWHLSHRTLSGTLPTKSANFSASPIGSIGSFDRWLKASVIRILLLTCCSFIS